MANTVIAIRSSGVTGNTPSLGVLTEGELSLNFADGILYYKTSANTLGSIYKVQPAGLTTEIQFNDGGSFGGNSAFTFNKTIATLNVTNINTSSLVTGGGAGGIIAGANVVYSNTFVANTGGYFQFADGTKQYTANADGAFAQAAFDKANSANVIAQSGYNFANTVNTYAYSAYAQANAANTLAQSAYNSSNTKFSSSGGTITGNVTVTGNVTGTYFIGDGSYLTNVAPTLQIYKFANVASSISTYYDAVSLENYTPQGSAKSITASVSTTPTLIASFATKVGYPNLTKLITGTYTVTYETIKASGPRSYYTYAVIYHRTSAGSESLVATTDNSTPSTLNALIQQTVIASVTTEQAISIDDRIVVKIYAALTSGGPDNISVTFDNNTNAGLQMPAPPASTVNFVPYKNATANVYLNAYSLIANTVDANNITTHSYIQFSDGTKQYTANAAATSDFTNITATAGTYGNSTYIPIVTVAANGRISTITSTLAAGSGGAADLTNYFPSDTDWGLVATSTYSVFGELAIQAYDCRDEPVTPRGYLKQFDYGYLS